MLGIIVLIILGIVSIINLYGEYGGKLKLRYFSKPILMPLLIVYYVVTVQDINVLIILALLCGLAGDVFLMKEEKLNVMLGIGSFFLGHVFYITYFLISIDFIFPPYFYLLIIPYIVVIIILFKLIYPYMGDLRIPGFLYMIIITLMSFTTAIRYDAVTLVPYLLPLFGSLLFIASDTVLALGMFKTKIKYGDVIVMLTYILAQTLITIGVTI